MQIVYDNNTRLIILLHLSRSIYFILNSTSKTRLTFHTLDHCVTVLAYEDFTFTNKKMSEVLGKDPSDDSNTF